MEEFKKITNYSINGSCLKNKNNSNIRQNMNLNYYLAGKQNEINISNRDLSFSLKKLLNYKNSFFFPEIKNFEHKIVLKKKSRDGVLVINEYHNNTGRFMKNNFLDHHENRINVKQITFIKCKFCNIDIDSTKYEAHEGGHPSKILDWLYLGSYINASNKILLDSLGIKYILNCALECKNFYKEDFNYMHIMIKDSLDCKIIDSIDEVISFIEEARTTNNKILVHCAVGKSRSTTFVIAYLMKIKKMSFNLSFDHVRKCRKIACPNPNFLRQLKEYEFSLRKKKI